MPVRMYSADGTPVDVPEDQVQQAYDSGNFGFLENQGVNVQTIDGVQQMDPVVALERMRTDPSMRFETSEAGAQRFQQKYYGGTPQQIATGITNFASEATLGLSDVANEALFDDYGQLRRELDAANPNSALGGKVAGFAAPLLLSGGLGGLSKTSTLAKAAQATPIGLAAKLGHGAEHVVGGLLAKTALGQSEKILAKGLVRALELGAAGAVESGIAGLGQGLTEHMISDDQGTAGLAERLWAGLSEGAAHGAIFGAGSGFLSGAVGEVAKRASKNQKLRDFAERFSQERAASALGYKPGDVARLGKKKGLGAVDEFFGETIEEVRNFKLKDGSRLISGSSDDIARKVTQASDEVGESIGAMERQLDDLVKAGKVPRPDMASLRGKLDDIVASSKGTTKTVQDRAQRAVKEVQDLLDNPAPSFDDLQKVKRSLQSQVFKDANGMVPDNLAELNKVRAAVREVGLETVENAKAALPKGFAEEYATANRQFGALSKAEEKIVQKAAAEGLRGGMSGFSFSEKGAAAMGAIASLASGNPNALLGGLAMAGGRKLARKFGDPLLSRLDDGLLSMVDKVAKADLKIDKSIHKLFHVADLGVHSTWQSKTRKERQKNTVDAALNRKNNETRLAAYHRKMKELDRARSAGPALLEQRIGNLASTAPNTAAALAGTIARGADYLNSVRPTPAVDTNSLTPHLSKPDPDPVSLAKFARAVEAVERPLAVLDKLESGTLTKDHVDAMKAVYPKLYERIQRQVMTELSEAKKPPSYTKRIHLGTLLDIPTDPSLKPDSIAATQQGYADPEPPTPKGQPPAGTMTRASDFALPSSGDVSENI